jgi:DUF4097 and DUF4098 domain-containing protein YvlB
MKALWLSALLFAGPAFAHDEGDVDKVNGSIRIDDGQTAGDLSTVNGSIRVGKKANVQDIETVNGSITLGDDASASGLDNVNGSVSLGERARVGGAIDSVNGSITLEKGADVKGEVSNVNGRIRLEAAHVGGGIVTSTGDLEIGADSRVENGIRVEKSNNWSLFKFGKEDVPRIVIGPGAVVEGTLKFEREVELYVSDKAKIGNVVGAKAIAFSGDSPP